MTLIECLQNRVIKEIDEEEFKEHSKFSVKSTIVTCILWTIFYNLIQ